MACVCRACQFNSCHSSLCQMDIFYGAAFDVVCGCIFPHIYPSFAFSPAYGKIEVTMNILITGGAGYIGSVTNWLLKTRGYSTVVFDNLINGHKEAVGDTKLIIGDLRSSADIEAVFEKNKFDAVVHFAALALAGESMQKPFEYFHNNIDGGLNLLEVMRKNSCKRIIFSSTCAVYGFPKELPVTEESPIEPSSVYGASKRNFEEILDWYDVIYGIKNAKLRYFNACGALPDGSLGEDHRPETHIIPISLKACVNEEPFTVFGKDYKTKDGTCVRDYVHVLDLAEAHGKAIEYLVNNKMSIAVNLGVGKGYSNLEIVQAVEKVTGKKMNIKYGERRPGDPDAIYADNAKAKKLLLWEPKYTDPASIIETAWRWHREHINGY